MRILVPVDDSEYALYAVDFIARRTTLLGSKPDIMLLNVQIPIPTRAGRLVGEQALDGYYEEEANKVFEPIREHLAQQHVVVEEKYVVGDPGDEIAAQAQAFHADLIVMGSRGQNTLKGLFFGSVSNSVLAKTKCPVLILRSTAQLGGDAMKVGVAVDGSKYGVNAVKYMLKHLSLFGTGAQFSLINVVSDYAGAVMPDMAGMALPALSEEEVLELQREEFETAMGPLRPLFAKAAVKYKEICLVGNAGDEIAAYAKKHKLNLVIMGSHGYGRFKSAIMGSTATRIAAIGNVPLLIIR